MPCYSPLKGFVSKSTGGIVFKRSSDAGASMEVSCGQCLGCRLDRSKEWAARIIHESQMHDDNMFLTLTYDDANMPRLFRDGPGVLVKSDFQKFMKRLRERISPKKVRYYMCGEYGEQDQRPHYHACIFGLDPQDKELFSVQDDYNVYTSKMIADCWGLGFITIGDLTFQSAGYVSRYVLKKCTGVLADEHYLRVDDYGQAHWLEPEFNTMSRRPGIGRDWYEKYKDDCFPSDELPVPGTGVFKKVPRYYEQILKGDQPELHDEVKRRREAFRKEHGEEYSGARLEAKYKVKKAQIKHLKREL